MSKPKIGGNEVIAADTQKKKQEIEKLTVLNEISKESIYNLVFAESENGSSKK